jgi:hypothetical protein
MFKFNLGHHLDITLLKTDVAANSAVAALPNVQVTVVATMLVSWGPAATAFANPSQGITTVGPQATGHQLGRQEFRYDLYDADLSPAAGGSAESALAAIIAPKVVSREKTGVDNPRADSNS